MEIEKACFTNAWSQAQFEQELLNDAAYYYVVLQKGRVAGFGGFWQIVDEGHIMNLAVSENWRRQGIGERLMAEMLAMGDKLGILYWTLEVRFSNDPARHLYEKCGFRDAGTRPGYYEKPKEDAEIYWLKRKGLP